MSVILSAAKDLRSPERGPSIRPMKILRLTAQDDISLSRDIRRFLDSLRSLGMT
jgi:hypothetical protein